MLKRAVATVGLLACITVCCTLPAATPPPTSVPATPATTTTTTTRPSAGACPDGHDTVKRVPVLYGLPAGGPELVRRVENLEVVLGGCIVNPGRSPRYLLICTRCGHRYNPVEREWTRRSADARSFREPLSELIRSFPLPDGEQRELPAYQQDRRDGRIVSESITYWTGETPERVAARVDAFVKTVGAVRDRDVDDLDDRVARYAFSVGGRPGELRVLTIERGETHVNLVYPVAPRPSAPDRSAAVGEGG